MMDIRKFNDSFTSKRIYNKYQMHYLDKYDISIPELIANLGVYIEKNIPDLGIDAKDFIDIFKQWEFDGGVDGVCYDSYDDFMNDIYMSPEEVERFLDGDEFDEYMEDYYEQLEVLGYEEV